MNWLMLPIFTSNFSIQAHSLLMQNFYRGSQALIAPFPKISLRYGGKDRRCQDLRCYAQQKNCPSKHSYRGSRQKSGRQTIKASHRRQRRFINENRLQYDQVIVKRDEAAEKRDRYEPQQAVVCTDAKSNTEEIKFSKKPGEWRYTCQ